MRFLTGTRSHFLLVAVALAACLSSGCHRPLSKEQKALRAEVSRAMREQSYEKAAALAREALQSTPHDSGLWDRLVQAQFALGDLDGAKRVLATWRVAVEKPSPKMEEYGGDIAMAEHEPAAASQYWSRALVGLPKNVRLLEKLARAENAQGKWDDENAAWKRVIDAHDNATARVHRALCRRRLHHWQDAFDDLQRAQKFAPEDAEVIRAGKLFSRLAQALSVIRELDARLVLSPNDAALLTDRAVLFLRQDDPELAIADCEVAMKAQTTAMRPRLFRALALLQLGRPDEATRLGVRGASRLDSFSPEALQTLGRLDSEISAETNNAELYVSRAWQLNDIGQPSLALGDAVKASTLDPKSAGALAETSYASMMLGRPDEAFDEVKRATEFDPHFSTAWQYRAELEMQRGDWTAAVESFSRNLAITQTATALAKREQCYRELGLLLKAEEDHRAVADLNARGLR